MIATAYTLSKKTRQASFGVAHIGLFDLHNPVEVPAHEILQNPAISLYCLDFESRRAVFVETPDEIDLSTVPFTFVTQFEAATRVLTTSFETLQSLAESIEIDDSKLVFIQSVGRCGSTLASQIFAQVPSVFNLSEPDPLMSLVIARNLKLCDEAELKSLLQASMCLLCRDNLSKTSVIKGRSFVIQLGDWLHELFPRSKTIFLYREAESWLRSSLRAFSRGEDLTEEEKIEADKRGRAYLGQMVPAIAEFDPDRYLPHAGTLTLMWLTSMEKYVELCKSDIDTLAIDYRSWQQSPKETAQAMLAFCNCVPEDLGPIYATLNQDSQEGTQLSQNTLAENGRLANQDDYEELRRHLERHAFIKTANYLVPSTLKS